MALAVVLGGATFASDQELKEAKELDAEISRLFKEGKHAEALPLAQRALVMLEKALGSEHGEVGTAAYNLGRIYEAQRRHAEAAAHYQRCLAIWEKVHGTDHARVGVILHELANLYVLMGRYTEAEPLYHRSIAITEKAVGADHADVAKVLNNLSNLYQTQSRFAEAEPLIERSLAISQKQVGPDHPQVATNIHNLAALRRSLGQYSEAEELNKRSLAIWEKAHGPDHPDVAKSLNGLAALYSEVGRFSDAEPLYNRSLAISEKLHGPESLSVATSLNNLAALYVSQGRYAEAETHYKRCLSIMEKLFGTDHPDTGTLLGNLAKLYRIQTRYVEAEALLNRSLAIREKALGAEHPDYGTTLSELASVYGAQGKYSAAEQLRKRALSIVEKALGPDHQNVAVEIAALADLYRTQGRYGEAEQLYARSLSTMEKALGANHPSVATALNNFAGFKLDQGNYADAERLFDRSIAISQQTLGQKHPSVGNALNNLAALYTAQGRYIDAEAKLKHAVSIMEEAYGFDHLQVARLLNNLAVLTDDLGRPTEAEPLYRRSLAIKEKTLGLTHPEVAENLNNLASYYHMQGRYSDAEPLLQRSVENLQTSLGSDHPTTAAARNNLAKVVQSLGRYSDAEQMFQRSLADQEKVLGPDHPSVAKTLNNLAELYQKQGRFTESVPINNRALIVLEKASGPDHPHVAVLIGSIARIALLQNNFDEAALRLRQASNIIQRRVERRLGSDSEESSKGEAQSNSGYFFGLVKTTHRLATDGKVDANQAAAEMFETAQWGQGSQAASSLAQMSARSAGGSPGLSKLVRERQDLVAEWRNKDESLLKARSQSPDKRDATAEKAASDRLAAIDERLKAIDVALARDFPDYAALASAKPIAVTEVQQALREDEALIMFLDTDDRIKPLPEETFVWVVTKADMRWVRSHFGTYALWREVLSLRCGLDASTWFASKIPCPRLTAANYSEGDHQSGAPLPFDAARAHALYKGLLGEAADMIKDKHLLIVPSGALTRLPFQVLATSLPTGAQVGEISREVGRLGAELGALDEAARGRLPVGAKGGVLVVKPAPGGAAEAAGIRARDVLLKVDAKVVETASEASAAIQKAGAGAQVTLTIVRDGQQQELKAVLGSGTVKDWKPLFLDATTASQVKWLAQDHAITVLPSVASLKALRRTGKPSAAQKPIIGFANPLLDGDQAHPLHGPYFKQQAEMARAQKGCAKTVETRTASLRRVTRSLDLKPQAAGAADLNQIRIQTPLPETADEVCEVVRTVGGSAEDIRIGENATEAEVKKLSGSGTLSQYRMLHFATHGTLAGQLSGTSEPGLILSPPKTATADDDGFLSGSEIASLKLDADWVILSACNTAGGAGEGETAEALSGLARVFFYAGARALLVSHWEVDSAAAVKLVTGAIGEMTKDPSVGRAEALRRAMLAAMADTSRPEGWPPAWHPSVWAPFVVVGEGGARS